MKTKEIEVWVQKNFEVFNYPEFVTNEEYKTEDFSVKAKLVIELPERSVSITESEFDELWKNAIFEEKTELVISYIKNALFGKDAG